MDLTWNLDTTVATAFNTLSGFLKAASSDNVQPLALLACQTLGATLAMCDRTINTVRLHAIDAPGAPTMTFLKATVGFYKNDCATQLAANQAGMRFLALATALVTTIDPYTGARAIELIMRDLKFPVEETPPVTHLRDLLAALEPRAEQCNFGKSVLQYQVLLSHYLQLVDYQSKALLDTIPSPEIIASLVDVLRKVQRVGDADITGATIQIRESAPWVIAFVTWCLGVPPSIYTATKYGEKKANPGPKQFVIACRHRHRAGPLRTTRRGHHPPQVERHRAIARPL